MTSAPQLSFPLAKRVGRIAGEGIFALAGSRPDVIPTGASPAEIGKRRSCFSLIPKLASRHSQTGIIDSKSVTIQPYAVDDRAQWRGSFSLLFITMLLPEYAELLDRARPGRSECAEVLVLRTWTHLTKTHGHRIAGEFVAWEPGQFLPGL